MKKILNLIWKEFIFGGHLQSLGAVSIVLISAFLLKIDITLDCLLAAYLIFYPLYLYNRFKEIEIDSLTNHERTNYLKDYIHKTPVILFLIVLILIGLLFYFSNPITLIFSLLLLFFGLIYSEGIKGLTKFIPLFKNFYVASFFALLVFFPIFYYNFVLSYEVLTSSLLLFIFIYLNIVLMQIFLDIKDIESDRKEGLKTLGVLLGKEKTIKTLHFLNIFLVLPLILILVYLEIFPLEFLALIFLIPINFYLLEKLKNYNNYLFFIFKSGEILIWFILIFIAKIL